MLSSYSRALACAVILGCAFASTLAQMSPPSSAALVEGAVVNKVTGAPVRHAHVTYIKVPGENSSPISTDTDSDGRFSIALEAGSYRLWVERPGFARQAYGSRTPEGTGTVLTLAAGQHLQDVNLRIVPLGAIAGRVFDEDGEPVQGAGIQVLRFSYATGKRQLIPVLGAGSNDRGEYRAFGLPAGRYFLLATLRGAPMSRPPETDALLPEMQQAFAAVYYPGVLDFASATQISLTEGGEISDADFHLQKVHAVMVRGRLFSPVQDFAGSQLQVVLAHNDGSGASFIDRASATIDNASGRFEFHGIAPGSYLVVASQLHGGRSVGGRVPIEVNANNAQENVNVPLTPAFDVPGTIEVEGGSTAKVPNITVNLLPSEGLALGPQPSSKVDPQGNFRLTGITPGNWDLTLSPLPEDLWIKTATFGGQDVLRGELNVTAGTKGPLHIVLSGNGAQISGAVAQAGQPSRATVVLVPAAADLQGSAQMYRSTKTGEQGTFLFRGVRPGAYKLFAFEDIEAFAWLDPDFLRPVESLGEPISVGGGEQATRQLAPVPPDALLPAR